MRNRAGLQCPDSAGRAFAGKRAGWLPRLKGMRWFEIVRVSCEGCGKLQDPDRWPGRCPGCARARFRAEIDRSASGLEAFELVDFIRGTSSDGPGNPCWRTQTFLTCSGVSGDEIAEFCGAGMDERRRMYVAWKRRELEAALTPDRAACGRC